MKKCGYCGGDNADEAAYCRRCGTEFVMRTPEQPKTAEPAPPIATTEPEPEFPTETEVALCLSCLAPNSPQSNWCRRCGAPMSAITGIVMPEAALAAGFVLRRAIEAPPNLLVICSIWLFCLPLLVGNALSLLWLFTRHLTGLGGIITFWFGCAGVLIHASVIFRATRNYYRTHR
jgi:ribosomal protein L40E